MSKKLKIFAVICFVLLLVVICIVLRCCYRVCDSEKVRKVRKVRSEVDVLQSRREMDIGHRFGHDLNDWNGKTKTSPPTTSTDSSVFQQK